MPTLERDVKFSGIYVKDDLHFKIRKDSTVNYGQEFESIFVEIDHNSHVFIVGEIYRVPNTNKLESIQRYEALLSQLSNFNGNVIVGTDHNFNLLNIEHHGNTQQLLNTFISAVFVPTITKATRISHGSSTLIDNLYVKYNQDNTDNRGSYPQTSLITCQSLCYLGNLQDSTKLRQLSNSDPSVTLIYQKWPTIWNVLIGHS